MSVQSILSSSDYPLYFEVRARYEEAAYESYGSGYSRSVGKYTDQHDRQMPINKGPAKKVDSDQSAHIKFKAEQKALAESVAKTLRRQKAFPLPENFDARIEAEGWKYAEKMAAKYLEWISTKASNSPAKGRPRKSTKGP
jgi:hypothetical protein